MPPQTPTRAITLCLPELGGVYSVVSELAKFLPAFGVSLSAESPATAGAGDPARARALLAHLAAERPRIVLFHALSGPVELNLARYLPREILRVLAVHNITPATYKAAAAVRDHVHATVCVSPRIHADLVSRHGFDPLWTFLIPNGIDTTTFALPRPERDPAVLRVLSHGRIDDAAKGVFWLPDIVSRALRAGARIELTVSGEGPDLPELQKRFKAARFPGKVRFTGPTPRRDVPALMAGHDALLFPSRFEGFPVTLLEAMAAGCIPVASRIRQVTDFLVRPEVDGLLFAPGSVRQAASHLARLASDAALAALLSRSARLAALRFGLRHQAEHYASVIGLVLDHPREIAAPLDPAAWAIPNGLRPGLRTSLPKPLKNALRVARERIPLF